MTDTDAEVKIRCLFPKPQNAGDFPLRGEGNLAPPLRCAARRAGEVEERVTWMAKFKYVARDSAGKRVSNVVESGSREEVLSTLRREKLVPLSVIEEAVSRRGKKGGFTLSLNLGAILRGGGPPRPHLKSEEFVVFTRQFATMISAGVPILECLDILQEQAEDPGFKHVLTVIVDDVRSGSDLSKALEKHRTFSTIYLSMIRAGEASGQLDVILTRLAEFMESTEKLKREIKSAMTYPVVSLALILGITTFLLVGVIPKFQNIFSALKVKKLPLPTQIVLGISAVVKSYAPYLVLGLVALVVLIRFWKKTESGGYLWDRMLLKVPIFGGLLQKVALSRFSRTFATLIRSGVPILGALDIVSTTAGNRVMEKAIDQARDAIRQGESLATPLGECPVFPPMVVRMIAIGEKSGALEGLLEKISEFYDQQVSATVESLTSLIEPLMIGIMGVVVGGMVLSVFLPIFKIQEALRKK